MTDIFNPILQKMADGNLNQIYAQAVIRLDKNRIIWDGVTRKRGSISIYTANDVQISGTVRALHPAVCLNEHSFYGNTTLYYELIPGKTAYAECIDTDGILICYNGGEQIVPMNLSRTVFDEYGDSKNNSCKEQKKNGDKEISVKMEELDELLEETQPIIKERREKQLKARIIHLHLELMHIHYKSVLMQESVEYAGIKKQKNLEEIYSEIQMLSRLCPENIRYKLYEIEAALNVGDMMYASKLERKIRSVIIASKKKFPTEYCMLLSLQYQIALKDQQYKEAGIKKQQLSEFIKFAIEKKVTDTDLIRILCGDCLQLQESSSKELWSILKASYKCGNNSPYLFLYGLILFHEQGIYEALEGDIDDWTGRCLYYGVKNDLLNPQLISLIAECRPDNNTIYILRTYEWIYDRSTSLQALSTICMIMIRKRMQNRNAFLYYNRAVEADFKIAKLYDYYIYSLPSGYDRPIRKEILEYFSLDDMIEAHIYIKLCLNVSRFYIEDRALYQRYLSDIEVFLKNCMMRKYWEADLAFLAEEVLDTENLDQELAQALIPVLNLVQVEADVPNGYQVVYESGIYKEPQIAVFKEKIACLCAQTEGYGTWYLLNRTGKKIENTELKIQPLFNNKNLKQKCEEMAAEDPNVQLMHTYLNIQKKQYELCDLKVCLQYVKDDSLADEFRRELITCILEYLNLNQNQSKELHLGELCRFENLMNVKERVLLTKMLIGKGNYMEALDIIRDIPLDYINSRYLVQITDALILYEESCLRMELVRVLLHLLDKNQLTDKHVHYLAEIFQGKESQMIHIYQICKEHKIACKKLKERLMLRIIMNRNTSLSLIQELAADLIKTGKYGLMIQAGLSLICHIAICKNHAINEELMVLLQSNMIHSGNREKLSLPCQLMFLKYDQAAGLHHKIEQKLLKEMCSYVCEQDIMLDFVEREAARYGMSFVPVIQEDLSAADLMGDDYDKILKKESISVWAEYYVEGENTRYRTQMKLAYGSIYSAAVMQFTGERIYYRIQWEQHYSDWKEMENWDEELSLAGKNTDDEGIAKSRYLLLQKAVAGLHSGEIPMKAMQEYERILNLIECIGE